MSDNEMTGGEAIARMIQAFDGGPMFGMGGFQLLPFYDAARRLGLEHHLINDERAAVFAADAYAKVSGKVGLADATLGPGATNLVTGLVEALIHDNVERDHAAMRRVAADLAADASVAGATQMTLMWAWTQRLVEALLADRHQAICRYELYLYAARRPAVQEVLRGYRNRVVAEQAAATRAAGVRHPVAAARLLLATFEGISLMNLSVPNAAQQAWAPTFLLAVSMASMNLVEPPGAPHDEAADIEAPLFEWLDPATGIVARQPDPARPPKADPV